MKGKIFLIILFLGIIVLVIGIKETPEDCSCKGVGSNYCLGEITCENNIQNCIPLTCNTKENLIGVEQTTNKTYTILMIDTSKSMEGEKISATILASKEFIQKMNNKEKIAIITFNDHAHSIINFTNNKTDLNSKINLITPQGKTKFYEAFNLARKLFQKNSLNINKHIIFLSDGTPEDNKEIFMNEVNKLKSSNVHIYSIGVNEKINKALMKLISSGKNNFFVVNDSAGIKEKFSLVYNTISQEKDLDLKIINQQKIASNKETIIGKLISKKTQENLLSQQKYCELKTTHYLEAKKENNHFLQIKGEVKKGEIHFPLEDLQSGTYELTAHSKITLDACSLHTTKEMGIIQIYNENSCKNPCKNIENALKQNKTFTYTRENDEAILWILFIDKSSSMKTNNYLKKAKNNVQTLISFLPVQDSITGGSFDTKTDILFSQEKPFSFNGKILNTIVPSASTQILVALKKAQKLEMKTPYAKTHTIIFSDGKYEEKELKKLTETVKKITGCISTINYGTHLLKEKEKAYEIIKTQRKCGYDFILEPTLKELQQLTQTNKSTTPHLIIELHKKNSKSEQIQIKIISTFTGETPKINTDECKLTPLSEITLTNENGSQEIITTKYFDLNNKSTYNIRAYFNTLQCNYESKLKQEINTKTNKTPIKTIILIVFLVLSIQLIVFGVVMNKKLHKIERKIKSKK